MVIAGVFACASTANAADLSAGPSNLAPVYAAAHAGDVIHLAAGNYGTFTGGSKPGNVLLTPADGVGTSSVVMNVDLTPASNLQINGVTVHGATLDGAHDVAFTNDVFTEQVVVYRSPVNSNTLFDHDSFLNIDVCNKCFTGRVTLVDTTTGDGAVNPDGVQVSNSLFSGGNSDGVDLFGATMGAQIGPGNEFVNLEQSGVQHTDPIQTYGGQGVIVGNWIHDDATSIMAPDGTDPAGLIISDNVCTRIEQQCAYLGFKQDVIVSHNTFTKGLLFNDAPTKSGDATSNVQIRNNVLQGGLTQLNLKAGAISYENYNLIPGGGSGNHDVKANAKFVGGASPTSWSGFQLVAGSPGTRAADDGADMGADFTGRGFPIPGPVRPGAGTPGGPGTGAGNGVLVQPPALTLSSPRPGGRFRHRIKMAVVANGPHGISRVEFWVDRRRVAIDRKAPYGRTWRIPRRFKRGTHTVSARAFGGDGYVSSVAVTVLVGGKKVHGARKRGWKLASAPVASGATVLIGTGRPRKHLLVQLSRCGKHPARVSQRRKLRAGRQGSLLGHARSGMCIVRLRPLR